MPNSATVRSIKFIVVACSVIGSFYPVDAQPSYVSFHSTAGYFRLAGSGKSTPLLLSHTEYPGVLHAASDLKTDIGEVTGVESQIIFENNKDQREVVIAGTIGKSDLIDKLVSEKKIDVSEIRGRWESFVLQVIEKPLPNIDRALVIAGSDKRGTIFGLYDLSSHIGVSPWKWWADVVPAKNKDLYVSSQRLVSGPPAVKYRGIFLNDEEPSLGRFAVEKFGGFNHEFYEKVFDLILRLKGNYLWPAMWWAAFNSDDPLNPDLADERGIVMGTTHHEPMMRAHAEWKKTGTGAWNYESNGPTLQAFWREGIRRMGNRESIVTLAMRGDGDMAMSAETNTALLERIVADQRKIIQEVTGLDPPKVPQLWALYKEVQDYYDKGMRVPDDVTLLLSDDNWGNIRKLPRLQDKPRAGGYGIYYHFDYVGDPRNYKWLNTNPIIKVWEQMHLAIEHGVDRIWIVNVGDLKPMEFPISFFLDYAWDPKKWNQNNLHEYTVQWATQQFGKTQAEEIALIIEKYSKYNGRRKPELLAPETYSLVNQQEGQKIIDAYDDLERKAERINEDIPPSLRDAYYELVLFPVKACANLNKLYFTVAKNRLYASQGRNNTNSLAGDARLLFQKDSALSEHYNKILAGGKWNNMMNQIHIGYTYWQDPKQAAMPETKLIQISVEPSMGVAVEGSEQFWVAPGDAQLPDFESYSNQPHTFEIFNRGQRPFDFTIESSPWLKFSQHTGRISDAVQISLDVDWKAVPAGTKDLKFRILGPQGAIAMTANLIWNAVSGQGFIESNHCISIEPEHYDRVVNSNGIHWEILPDYGRTLSGVTPFPVVAESQTPTGKSPHLEYDLFLFTRDTIRVSCYLGTTLNFPGGEGLRIAVSLDHESPQIINIHKNDTYASWEKMVEDNIRIVSSRHAITAPGKHILKYWMVDPGVVVQKIVIETGPAKYTYLGPRESVRIQGHK